MIDYAAANRGFAMMGSDLRRVARRYQRLSRARFVWRRKARLAQLEAMYREQDEPFLDLATALGMDDWELRRRSWCNLRGIDWTNDEMAGAAEVVDG